MHFVTHSFRHANVILNEPAFFPIYSELIDVINSISEVDIIFKHNSYEPAGKRKPKSISVALNQLFKERLQPLGWVLESPIFQDPLYLDDKWRLDFAKSPIAVEVAFNHGEATSWNLIKPVLSSELNHVNKAIQTEVGIVITVTNRMKSICGFDSSVGSYEKFLTYLKPLNNLLSVPLLIIGLTPPTTFRIEHSKIGNVKIGNVIMNAI